MYVTVPPDEELALPDDELQAVRPATATIASAPAEAMVLRDM
jgi:hypothetical protein